MKIQYQAYDTSGQQVAGTIDAADVNEAAEKLRRQGLFVARIGDEGSTGRSGRRWQWHGSRRKRLKQVAMFARQMHVLVSSGTQIVEALEALEQQVADPDWRGVVGSVRKQVEEGASLADAVKEHPAYFDPVVQHMIEAGESTGKMGMMLDRVAALVRKQVQVRSLLMSAMIYPTLLVAVAVNVLGTMLLFVLPRFEVLFKTLHVSMPPSTAMMMGLSSLVRGYWWAMLIGLLATAIAVRVWMKSSSGKACLDTVLLRLPLVGSAIRSFATARIARLLGIMLDSYMPLLDVLTLIRHTMANGHYVKLIESAEEAVTQGQPISSALQAGDLISPSVCQVVRSGEQSGQLAPLLLNLADLMDEENDVFVKSITSIVEPIILILLGLVVGFVTLTMFMPLFDLSSAGG